MSGENSVRLFEIVRTGDPHNPTGWDVREYKESFNETTCVFRGDLSPIKGRTRAFWTLRRLYPGCRIKITGR